MAMRKRCLVNVASTQGYPRGQARLTESLIGRFNGATMIWTNRMPKGSPSHADIPYGFKLYAIQEAIDAGHQTIIWCDAAVWAVKDLGPLTDRIESEGHYFFHGGASLGQRCSDDCLKIMGFEREKAWGIQLIGGTVYGFDMTNPRTQEFMKRWWAALHAGAFRGAAINDVAQDNMCGLAGRPVGHVSDDPRVQGHCHDESAATIIAHQLGMASVGIGDVFAPYSEQNAADPRVYLVSQGL